MSLKLTSNGLSKKLKVWPKRQVFQSIRCTSGHGTREINSKTNVKLPSCKWTSRKKGNKKEEITHKRQFAQIKHPRSMLISRKICLGQFSGMSLEATYLS